MYGPHVSLHGAPPTACLIDAQEQAYSCDRFVAKAFAVFVSNPRKLQITFTESDCASVRKFVARGNRVVAHSTYAAYPWGANPHGAIRHINAERHCAELAGISALVVHLPGRTSAGQSVLEKLADVSGCPVYFENPAVRPPCSYASASQLCGLLRAAKEVMPDAGLAIDTAHLWTAGIDIRDHLGVQEFLDEFHDHGLSKALLFHLNSSTRPLGYGPDEHDYIFRGQIWQHGDGYKSIVRHADTHNNTVILERSRPEIKLLCLDYALVADARRTA